MTGESDTGWLLLTGARLEGDQRFVYGQGRALCDAVARYRPWLEREARTLVRGDKQRARRLARRALERLWEWDVTRFSATDDAYLRRALVAAMRLAMKPAHRRRPHPGSSPTAPPDRTEWHRYFASVRGMELE